MFPIVLSLVQYGGVDLGERNQVSEHFDEWSLPRGRNNFCDPISCKYLYRKSLYYETCQSEGVCVANRFTERMESRRRNLSEVVSC
jgi:hypothetical protein